MKIKEMFNIGKSKYVVNYSNGEKKHKDGSEFWDIAIFSNKKKKDAFIKRLKTNIKLSDIEELIDLKII